jgi:hypothetical protein
MKDELLKALEPYSHKAKVSLVISELVVVRPADGNRDVPDYELRTVGTIDAYTVQAWRMMLDRESE